jgi:predicted GNAT family acetyltransferase
MRKALKKAGWEVADVDLWEVNEAFAVVAMIAQQELGFSPDKLNVNGGACALGHPIGASGARILCTLIAAYRRGAARRGWRRCASAAARPRRWRSSSSRICFELAGSAFRPHLMKASSAVQARFSIMTDTFRQNTAQSRYELEVDGLLAFADYRRSGERLIIPHVESDPALRNQGAAARLMENIVAAAREEGLRITPLCSYAAAWMRRNEPDLIA